MNLSEGIFNILIVDDREENLISLEEMLEADNRYFIRATSGDEALKKALKENISLILLDVQMPGMDGFEVARLLKSNSKTKDIAIIFVTAISKEERFVLKGFEEGAVDYLHKPLDVDVTRAKVAVFERLYFAQKQLKDALVEKDKVNKQLERFMYVVAHDLKSPLAGVVSLLTLMKDDERLNKGEDLREYMNLLMQATSHLTGMIGSILEYSRQNNTQLAEEKVDVHELVLQIAHLLFPPKHIHISIEGHLPVVKTYKLKLQQVFQNLISNAIKYNDKKEGEIIIGCQDDEDDFYTFYVKDNGPGIESADQLRIFKLFETTANKNEGESATGVGLNILKVLIEEQGGKIWVDSWEGTGSTFHFQWRK